MICRLHQSSLYHFNLLSLPILQLYKVVVWNSHNQSTNVQSTGMISIITFSLHNYYYLPAHTFQISTWTTIWPKQLKKITYIINHANFSSGHSEKVYSPIMRNLNTLLIPLWKSWNQNLYHKKKYLLHCKIEGLLPLPRISIPWVWPSNYSPNSW